MNLPNKLTVLRIVLVPFFMFFLLAAFIPYNYTISMAIFIVASVTDWVDGKIARKYNLITDFGKFLDPIADKALVVSAFICFVELGWTESWVVVVIVLREFLVTSLRLLANKSNGLVISADWSGKVKTVVQMVAISAILLMNGISFVLPSEFPIILIGKILMYIALAATVYSGVSYMWKYRSLIDVKK